MNQIKGLSRFLSYNLSLVSHICILYAMQGDYYFATFTKSNNILIFLFWNSRHDLLKLQERLISNCVS